MENNIQPNTEMKKDHICTNDHCCGCSNCGPICTHGVKKKYWIRHFIVLVIGVIAAFWVGYQLGEIKGSIISGSENIWIQQ